MNEEKLKSRRSEMQLLEDHLKILHKKYGRCMSLHEFDVGFICFKKYWKYGSLIHFENDCLKKVIT